MLKLCFRESPSYLMAWCRMWMNEFEGTDDLAVIAIRIHVLQKWSRISCRLFHHKHTIRKHRVTKSGHEFHADYFIISMPSGNTALQKSDHEFHADYFIISMPSGNTALQKSGHEFHAD
ncbi:hypothetical protein CEXT_50861 [Caerostris extrusa]|uniref:Uncharacterized protein n=1 Tax=Caerostris extrusa TaxID=172846 RepID=A0AAV4MYZ1_CAEEX|nr:hypothetical protein CEXT_50861 [Caerostris extrusa]